MAMPPVLKAEPRTPLPWQAEPITQFPLQGGMANLWPGFFLKPRPGVAQEVALGNVTVPTLYACGKKDFAIKCNHPYALKTKDYVDAPFTYFEADCGHDMLKASNPDLSKLTTGIINHIAKAS